MRTNMLNDEQHAKVICYMVSSSDHVTPLNGLTLEISRSKNGGAFANCSGSVNELGNGFYCINLSSVDVDTYGPLVIVAKAAGADPFITERQIVHHNPYAMLIDSASIVGAIKNSTGWTENNGFSFQEVIRLLFADRLGKVRQKAGHNNTYEVMDPDDDTVVVMEFTVNKATSPYRVTTPLI